MLLFGLVGGVAADRFPKRTILLATQSLIGIAAVISAALVLAGVVEVWHLALIAAMQGLGFAFNMPARQAFVAQLVGRDRLMNAVALNNAGMNFSRVVGPDRHPPHRRGWGLRRHGVHVRLRRRQPAAHP
jgi:MFS family permease